MKKHILPIILIALLAAANIGLAHYVYNVFSAPEQKMPEANLEVVKAPEQAEAMTLPVETAAEEFVPVTPEGVNVALKGAAKSGGYQDVYLPNLAVNGDTSGPSYWEGEAGIWPNWFSVDFDDTYPIYCIKLGVCPAKIWGKRTQEFSIEVSEDGENYTEIVPNTKYQFDPLTGNYVIVEFDEVTAKSIKLVFQSNSGATGPQIAELEAYAKIKK
ncbi:MAG: discoidin domain-containing protein [Lachnospiraceae bacterium]|nr:discoidin domain-containing protein [Lachnospiraceae bacterium]